MNKKSESRKVLNEVNMEGVAATGNTGCSFHPCPLRSIERVRYNLRESYAGSRRTLMKTVIYAVYRIDLLVLERGICVAGHPMAQAWVKP